jgi:hypothetical protein
MGRVGVRPFGDPPFEPRLLIHRPVDRGLGV